MWTTGLASCQENSGPMREEIAVDLVQVEHRVQFRVLHSRVGPGQAQANLGRKILSVTQDRKVSLLNPNLTIGNVTEH